MRKQARHPESKHAWLLEDDGVGRWIKNMERGSIITAEVSLSTVPFSSPDNKFAIQLE